jgi:hypothetical protein
MKAVPASTSISSGTIVLIKPFALGHECDLTARRAGIAKLATYWKRAGFMRIG